jgi:N-acetylmuramoyl-L-alanine amidase
MKRHLFIFFTLLTIFVIPFSPAYVTKAAVLPIKPIKILLVPGHDNQVWGAEYGNMKEATMTLALATQIYNILKQDKRFDVYITRDSGGYTKTFADYYPAQKDAILAFEQNAKKLMQGKISSGNFVVEPNAPHHTVSNDVALRLYGFNKWADENNIDAMIQIHFNDYPLPTRWTIGKYTGFAIYMPNNQFPNSEISTNLAKSIFTELHKKYIPSDYKPEAGGLVPDGQLIAIGANGTLNASVRSVLIEYSYIYEKKFRTSSGRLLAYKNMAQETATGIQNYFFPTSP